MESRRFFFVAHLLGLAGWVGWFGGLGLPNAPLGWCVCAGPVFPVRVSSVFLNDFFYPKNGHHQKIPTIVTRSIPRTAEMCHSRGVSPKPLKWRCQVGDTTVWLPLTEIPTPPPKKKQVCIPWSTFIPFQVETVKFQQNTLNPLFFR